MDNQKPRGILHRLVFGRGGPAPARKEMTRGEQTAWILAAIAIVGFFAYNYAESRRDPCASIFAEQGCETNQIIERLQRL